MTKSNATAKPLEEDISMVTESPNITIPKQKETHAISTEQKIDNTRLQQETITTHHEDPSVVSTHHESTTAVVQPNMSMVFLHSLITHDRQTTVLRLLLPFVISIMMTVFNYSTSIVFMALFNSLLIISLITIRNHLKQNHEEVDIGWLGFISTFMSRYSPILATRFHIIAVSLCVLYIFVTDLALNLFSLCFVRLFSTMINY